MNQLQNLVFKYYFIQYNLFTIFNQLIIHNLNIALIFILMYLNIFIILID
jgi:hypothetical protein